MVFLTDETTFLYWIGGPAFGSHIIFIYCVTFMHRLLFIFWYKEWIMNISSSEYIIPMHSARLFGTYMSLLIAYSIKLLIGWHIKFGDSHSCYGILQHWYIYMVYYSTALFGGIQISPGLLRKAVPDKFYGSGGHRKRNCLQDRSNFHSSRS